jgi:hypothetical protein
MFRVFHNRLILFTCLCSLAAAAHAQKTLYIPNDWRDTTQHIPWDSVQRMRQSADFAVFWGPLAGADPTQATDPALRFDPQVMLDSMESVYHDYVDRWGFLPDSGNLARYKCIITMNNTWPNGLYTGYLYGGGWDNVIGGMWIDPGAATNRWGMSHEFTHACQYMVPVLYPGHGFNDPHTGFFWETHAQFMAWQRNPDGLGNADMPRALNLTSYTLSSARKHYANLYYLNLLKDRYGLDFIGRIWREADQTQGEHPFQTIQRLLGLDQGGMNDFFMEHAMRNVTWDYSNGPSIRASMATLSDEYLWRPTYLLDSLGRGHYAIPDRLAPQQYGYNVIRLYPTGDSTCTARFIHLVFKGHTDPGAHSGWLYGFVGVKADGTATYSDYFQPGEVTYTFPDGTQSFYLVVMGAPSAFQVHTGLFEIGFPKEFRYPWEIHLEGMIPEGYQPGFRGNGGQAGAAHANGGGFVAATAQVDPGVFVGPQAAVLDGAQVTGNARIEGKALVKGNAQVSGNAIVKDFALVGGTASVGGNAVISEQGEVYDGTIVGDQAAVKGNAVLFYTAVNNSSVAGGDAFCWGCTLGGSLDAGGDAEALGTCSAGTYLQVPGLVSSPGALPRAACDGQTANILNTDTNQAYTPFTDADLAFSKKVVCGVVVDSVPLPSGYTCYPNPAKDILTLTYPRGTTGAGVLVDMYGRTAATFVLSGGSSMTLPLTCAAGMYVLRLQTDKNAVYVQKIVVLRP